MRTLFTLPYLAGSWLSLLATSYLLISSSAYANEIKVIEATDPSNELALNILTLALSKVSDSYSLTQMPNTNNNTERNITKIESNDGSLDVMWSGASEDLDTRLQTVRIPIFKGMLGHRIFIIRNGEQHRFNSIKSLSDLNQFDAGQGTFWGDTRVLKSAGIPTITTRKYNNLFKMLEGSRFDYFPRAIHEPWSEVSTRPELNLVVEKNVMLVYPYAMYFYVNNQNKGLHDKIYQGFEIAIQDGSFDKLFFSAPSIKSVLEKANLKNRTVIRIDNPMMHPDTPFDRKEFWLDLEKL